MKTKASHNSEEKNPEFSLTLLWDGEKWEVEWTGSNERLRKGASVKVPLPESVILPPPRTRGCQSNKDRKLLFESGTTLFFRLPNARETDSLAEALERHCKDHGIKPPKPEEGVAWVPILLKEDLYIQKGAGAKTWSASDCLCEIPVESLAGGHVFSSLNMAASRAKTVWGKTRTPSTNVFDNVYFQHKRDTLAISHKRRLVVEGVSIPETPAPVGPTLPGF